MLRASLAPPDDRAHAHFCSGLAEVLNGMDYAAVLDERLGRVKSRSGEPSAATLTIVSLDACLGPWGNPNAADIDPLS
jgi:hypothetical protein